MSLTVDRAFVTETLAGLVRINSVNPDLDPTGPGEAEVAAYVASVLEGLGLTVERSEPKPGRVSVIGRLPGSGRGRSLMLNAHIDTVGVNGMADPFGAQIRDGKLFGRGAYDMKGAMAACVGAVKALLDGGGPLAGDVVVAGVADEEYASLGTADVIERCPVDGAIVTEPTALRVCLAHKGFVWLRVRVRGRAAHGSKFEDGIDANMRMGRVLAALEDHERSLRTGSAHPLVGPPSLHAALLRGGSGISTYAADCELQIERRTVPGETVEQVEGEIAAMLAALRDADPTFDADLERICAREPFEVAPEATIVGAVERAAQRVTGRSPPRVGDTPWMDSALLAAAGVETVVIGPGGGGAHADEEWVDLQSVTDLAAVLAQTAVDYCGEDS